MKELFRIIMSLAEIFSGKKIKLTDVFDNVIDSEEEVIRIIRI